jgi:carboxypeptidase PM20D1
VGGERGAKVIASLLEARGVRAEFVLDEGLLITDGIIPGLDAPAALIGVAEKGYVSTKLTVTAEPGHAAMPPTDDSGAVTKLSEILLRLRDDPMPAAVTGVAREMFQTLAPEMRGTTKVVLTNLQLFEPLVAAQLTRAPETNAMLRTTAAFTLLAAGNADNVLPGRASATLNFRLLPGTSSDDVIAYAQRHAAAVLPADRFTVEKLTPGSEASAVSPTTARGYRVIERALRELDPGVVVAPGLMLAATDSRHFRDLAEQIYRFSPIRATREDLARFHGTNERLAVSDLVTMIRFYQRIIELSAGR